MLEKKGTVLAGSLSDFVMPEITSNWLHAIYLLRNNNLSVT